jgi:hypothetical protein
LISQSFEIRCMIILVRIVGLTYIPVFAAPAAKRCTPGQLGLSAHAHRGKALIIRSYHYSNKESDNEEMPESFESFGYLSEPLWAERTVRNYRIHIFPMQPSGFSDGYFEYPKIITN